MPTPKNSSTTQPGGSAPGSLADLFHRHGLRRTRQREVLFTALAGTTSHPTAEELHGLVEPSEAGLSLATVYNTLETFERVGLCRSIAVGSARRYDADVAQHAHVITDAGAVLDVPAKLGSELMRAIDPAVLRKIEAELGVQIARVSLQLEAAPAENARPDAP